MLYRELSRNLIYGSFSNRRYGGFGDWCKAAQVAAEELSRWHAHEGASRSRATPFQTDIYRALKQCLKTYFHNKCAYCESEFDSVAWGDVEHYRPKAGVVGAPDHPGYYWLAYCEANLLPSCQKCNSGKGKRNQFPIAGIRAKDPKDSLEDEKPVLLCPYVPDDCGSGARHLRFVFEYTDWDVLPTGRVEGTTERGRTSIEIYDLNRRSLVLRRRRNQALALRGLRAAAVSPRALELELKLLLQDDQEHASAVRAACCAWLAHYRSRLDRLHSGAQLAD